MNNSVIDVAFIAAKVAAIKDEKARMIVGGATSGWQKVLTTRIPITTNQKINKQPYLHKQSSGACASLLLLLEYVTFWLNQYFKCWGKPPFALGSLSKFFFYLLLLQGACQNVFFTSLCSRGLVKRVWKLFQVYFLSVVPPFSPSFSRFSGAYTPARAIND